MHIQINKEQVRSMDITPVKELAIADHRINMEHDAGHSPHNLYAYMSLLFDNTTILDIGTNRGNSALSLSWNPTNQVQSYDLVDHIHSNVKKPNIRFNICNFMQDTSIQWDNVKLILIDVDPHDGIQEVEMMKYLDQIGWTGLLLHDDISPIYWPALDKMWQEITYEKFDLTDIGHMGGTGLVNFGNKYKIDII